jgi:hypothetical protein
MKRLTILAAALMAAGANAQHRGDPSLDEAARQWEERIKSSPTIQRMQSDIATLKAEHARMGVSSTKANPTYLYPDNTPISVSNGSVVIGGQPSSLCYVNEAGTDGLPEPSAGRAATAPDGSGVGLLGPDGGADVVHAILRRRELRQRLVLHVELGQARTLRSQALTFACVSPW